MSRRWLALGLGLLVLALHYRWFLEGGLLGAPRSDVIRGVWGLDQQTHSFALWGQRVGFPEGSKLLVLPWLSSLVAAPLVWVLGSVNAYNLWVLLLLWGTGLAAGLLAQEVTEEPGAGWLVGCAMISQPMTWLAITDGTPENVAFWAVPLMLLCLRRATADVRWGIAAGGMATVVALDSPYHAIFSLPFVPLMLRWEAGIFRFPFWKGWGMAAAAAGVGVLILVGAYWGLPVGSAPAAELSNNAAHVQNWVQWEKGSLREPWDWTYSPCFIPLWTLVPAVLLALTAPRRALPWVAVGFLCLLFALGPGQDNPKLAGDVLGGWAKSVLQVSADLQAAHPMPVVRFLRRWLVPAAFAFGMAAEVGLSERPRLRWLGPILGLMAVAVSVSRTSYPQNLPLTHPIFPESCSFILEYPESGAILVLPRTRAATRLHQRDELPVFASLGEELSSAAELWLQVQSGRAAVNTPNGLLTLVPRRGRSNDLQNFFRDLDDLTLPQTIGTPIPPSAIGEPERRAATARSLLRQGLRFLLVDEQVYGPEGLKYLRIPFQGITLEERHFDEGTGVTVLVLGDQGG